MLAEMVGIAGNNIMFSSNFTPENEYKKALELGAILNLDDINHISLIHKNFGLPEIISLRYNPGSLKSGNSIIGKPEESKFGMTRKQIINGFLDLKNKGVSQLGLHTMVASNELDQNYFAHTAALIFDFVKELKKTYDIDIEFVNLGGGIGVPYHPNDDRLSYGDVGRLIEDEYNKIILSNNLQPLKLFLEMGRSMTATHGFLICKVEHVKQSYKNYIGLDANMANLMHRGMYGAYHHISILGKNITKNLLAYDVVGSLCENNDKFAIDRILPEAESGDIVIIHDTGAHGHSMGFNYNGKLRSAELLLRDDGAVELIRRAETIDDYFKTIVFKTNP